MDDSTSSDDSVTLLPSPKPKFFFTRTHGAQLDKVNFSDKKGYFISGEGVDDSIIFRKIWIPEKIAKRHKGFPFLDTIDMHGDKVSFVFYYKRRYFHYNYDYIVDGKNKCMRLIFKIEKNGKF